MRKSSTDCSASLYRVATSASRCRSESDTRSSSAWSRIRSDLRLSDGPLVAVENRQRNTRLDADGGEVVELEIAADDGLHGDVRVSARARSRSTMIWLRRISDTAA